MSGSLDIGLLVSFFLGCSTSFSGLNELFVGSFDSLLVVLGVSSGDGFVLSGGSDARVGLCDGVLVLFLPVQSGLLLGLGLVQLDGERGVQLGDFGKVSLGSCFVGIIQSAHNSFVGSAGRFSSSVRLSLHGFSLISEVGGLLVSQRCHLESFRGNLLHLEFLRDLVLHLRVSGLSASFSGSDLLNGH